MTVRVLSTMRFEPAWLEAVAAVSDRVELRQIAAESCDELPEDALREVEVLYTGSAFPRRDQAPALRWVQLDTSGADHVRGTPLWGSDVVITSIGGISPRPIAEYVIAALLALAHRLPRAAAGQRGHEWPSTAERWAWYRPVHVPGSRMAVVGYGSLGRSVARAARAFGIDVTGVRRGGSARSYDDEPGGIDVVTAERLDDALATADWVVVCVPRTPETTHLIGAAQFASMKPGAHLINVARGGVVDEDAMLAALDSGRLAGAVLDVFDQEPLPPGSPLWEHPGVLLTPHISGLASDYEQQVRLLFRDNLARYLEGRPLRNVIDRTLGY